MVDDIFEEFCKIPRWEKANHIEEYLDKLDACETPQTINRDNMPLALSDSGGKLLGEFLRRRPSIKEINIPNHQMRLSTKPDCDDGWNAFLDALAETKASANLQVLNLSLSLYSSEMLLLLGKKVLCDHPSLRTLHLNSCGLKDCDINTLEPYLRMPSLRSLSFRSNRIKGECFEALVERLKESCPHLTELDLTTCNFDGAAYSPMLIEWLRSNPHLHIKVSLVGYEDIVACQRRRELVVDASEDECESPRKKHRVAKDGLKELLSLAENAARVVK